MSLREKKKKKIVNNAMMSVVEVDIEEAGETSEDLPLLQEATEVVVQENTKLVHQLISAKVISAGMMIIVLLEIDMVVEQGHQAIVEEMRDVDTDK
jgi:hypothetical protein